MTAKQNALNRAQMKNSTTKLFERRQQSTLSQWIRVQRIVCAYSKGEN